MASITSTRSLVLDLPPSCIEFCPAARDYLVVGTYFLEKKEQDSAVTENEDDEDRLDEDKKPQTRTGSLILMKVDGDQVLHISTTSTPYAILDLHFNPHDPHLLAVASSTGSIQLFHLTTTTPASLLPLQTHQFFSPQTLVLSLSWHPTNPSLLGTTLSNGQVHLLNLSTPDAEPKHLLTHELEAWTLAFSPSGEEIYSGGDDAALRFSNNVLIAEEGTALQWCDQRAHTAGVTAILPLVGEENVVLTGSYDDCMRVLYTPLQGRRQVLAEENLEGGVWRLKMLVADAGAGRYTILASCMHAGSRIVEVKKDVESGEWGIHVLARFEEHKSMNYGSDVQPGCDKGGAEQTILSTSFYDKLLCLWRFTLP